MSLREGLASLKKVRNEEEQQEPVAQAPAPVAPVEPAAEQRQAFTSRMRPSQRRYLRQLLLDMEEEAGRRVTLEDLLDAVVTEMQESRELRTRVIDRVK